jgi:hypothetical protein
MSTLTSQILPLTVNGVPVVKVERVAWKPDDDPEVVTRCDARGLVLFEGGGKSDAIVVEGIAMIWERNGERFRGFSLEHAPRATAVELHAISARLRRVALRAGELEGRSTAAVLLHLAGVINAFAMERA